MIRAACLPTFVFILGGCGGAKRVDTGALAALDDTTSRIEPAGERASSYESKPAALRVMPSLEDPLRLRLVQGLQRAGAAEGIAVVPDERLDQAMADLARALGDDDTPRSEAVEFLLGYRGIIEPYPVLSLAGGELAAEQRLADKLLATAKLPHAPAVTVGIGIDRSRSLNRVIVALQEKHLDLRPVAREQPALASFELAGALLGRFSQPTLYVTSPGGEANQTALRSDGVSFRGRVACDRGDGRYQVEVFGSDDSGPRVLANFAVFCGVAAPRSLTGRAGYIPQPVAADDAEDRLLALVNSARATAGLAALAPDPALARVARAHSADMLANNFTAHISPTSGSPADRVSKAGIAVGRLLENIGASSSPEEVHLGLMRSPGHRSAILDPEVTHVGIGVAVPAVGGTVRVIATELFR